MSTTSSTAEEKVNSVYASRQSLKDNKVHEDLHSDVHIQDDGFAISVLSGGDTNKDMGGLLQEDGRDFLFIQARDDTVLAFFQNIAMNKPLKLIRRVLCGQSVEYVYCGKYELRWSSPHVLKYDEFASYMRCHACASHTPPVQVIDAWEALEVDQEQRQERLAGMSPQELRNETGFNLLDAIDVMLIKLLRQPDQEALIPRQMAFEREPDQVGLLGSSDITIAEKNFGITKYFYATRNSTDGQPAERVLSDISLAANMHRSGEVHLCDCCGISCDDFDMLCETCFVHHLVTMAHCTCINRQELIWLMESEQEHHWRCKKCRKSGAAVQAGLVYEDVHKTAQTASQAANPAAEAVPAVFPGSASEVPFTDLPSRNQHQKDHIDLAAATPITVKLEKSESAELSPVNSPAGRPKRARRQPEFYNPSPGQRAVSHVVSIDTTDIDSETSQEEHKTHEISGRARSTRHTPTHQQGHSQAVPQPVDLPNDANVEDAAPAAAMAGRLPASAASDQPELLWSGSQGSLSVRTSSESYPDSKSPSPRGTPTACQAAAHEQQSTMNAETAARQGPQQQSQLHDVDRLARTGGPPLTEAVDERGCDAPHSPHATSALQSAPSQVPSLAAVESAVHVSISAAISAVNKKLSSQSAIVQGQMRNYTNLHELLELYNALDMVDFKNNLRDVGKLDLNQTLYMYDHIKECRESR